MKSLTFGLGLRSNDVMATRRSTKKRTIGLMSKTTTSHVHHTSLYNSLSFLHYHDVKMPKAPSTHIRIILKTDFFPSVFKTYRVFHMTSRRPYWCPKTMKRRPCWCPKPVLWELNSFLMQTLSFVTINLHRCCPRE